MNCCSEIEDRLDAVTELCGINAPCMTPLKNLLSQLPDLERGLCTIYHRKVRFSVLKCIWSNNKSSLQKNFVWKHSKIEKLIFETWKIVEMNLRYGNRNSSVAFKGLGSSSQEDDCNYLKVI